jgi:DNA-directed RNA polymerase subunit L
MEGDNQAIHFIIRHNPTILFDQEYKQIAEVTTQNMYWMMRKSIRPTSESKWKGKCNIDFSIEDWSYIYTLPATLTKDTRILSLQYKITHRILACNDKLNTWKIKDNKICNFCDQIDTIEHYLYTCEDTYTLWQHIFKWWTNATGIGMPISCNEILFGLPNPNKDIVIKHYNYLIIYAKYYINKCKQTNAELFLYTFLLQLKNAIMLKIASCETANQEKQENEWKDLLEVL